MGVATRALWMLTAWCMLVIWPTQADDPVRGGHELVPVNGSRVGFLPTNNASVYYEFMIPVGDESPNSLLSRCRRRATGADEVDVRNDDEVSEILFKFIEVKPGLMKGKTFVIRLYL
ncbi:unnamed protein product [Toxocara canis]|uniref:Cadherin domain-containing protein n=1 Tax=Toxocara canis TaxID=6265 RepID=A0A183U596_TOXCA|nr:unnamed protein product [Toxocara canis]